MFRSRTAQLLAAGLLLMSWLVYSQSAQMQIPPGLRAQKNTYPPLVDVLAPKRTRVTDEQLAKPKR